MTTAVAVVGMETKVALRLFWRKVKEAMEHMYPDFDWDVDYVLSDGATRIGSSANKIWSELNAWFQCLFHVIFNVTPKLRDLVAYTTVRAERRKCLEALSFVWSLAVFVAGWPALRAQYSAFRAFLAYVPKEYIHHRTNWFSGASPPSIPAATPSEPSVNVLKFDTEHRMSTLAKFLVDGIPNLGKCWTGHSYAFMGSAPLSEPWMWHESQASHKAASFFDAENAPFFH